MGRTSLTLLIDADVVAYQAAAAGQDVFDFGVGEKSVAAHPIEQVVEDARKRLEDVRAKFGKGTDMVLCFTDSEGNFRKRILPTYKSNRSGVAKPVHLLAVKAELGKHYKTYFKTGLEGDDIMGILATHPKLIRGDKCIVSIDKDLRQIPGALYNPQHDTFTRQDKIGGDYVHMTQTLTGDTTDGYKGLPGCGPKGAVKVLGGERLGIAEWWGRVREAFLHKAANGGLEALADAEREVLVQARVSKILQHTDYNFKTKEPILWQPPKQKP